MNAWRLIVVPFLITLVLSVTLQSKGKFLWGINPADQESNDGRILSQCGDNHGGLWDFLYSLPVQIHGGSETICEAE